MRTIRRWVYGAGLLAALSGCVNYRAVSAFADQTTQISGAMRSEFERIGELCVEQADMRVVIIGALDPGDETPLQSCRVQGDALTAFQEVTVDTIDLYARTLLVMVDDGRFDLRPSIEATGQKVSALKTREGAELLDPAKVGAITRVLGLLADVIVQKQREAGVRRLVEVGPDLEANARSLRAFFVATEGLSPYQRWMDIVDSTAGANAVQVAATTPLSRQEPIRSAELRRAIARSRPAIDERRGTGPGAVPGRLVAALDAWIDLLPAFREQALQPDPQALLTRIDSLRTQALDARQAVLAAF